METQERAAGFMGIKNTGFIIETMQMKIDQFHQPPWVRNTRKLKLPLRSECSETRART